MKSLMLQLLKKHRRKIIVPFPDYWDYTETGPSGKILKKDLYGHLIDHFENYILKAPRTPVQKNILNSIIYGAFVRTTTAFDFDRDNRLLPVDRFGLREPGTILRMFLLFPLLLRMGVNVIYLLPVTASSRRFRKGRAPSPYACKNFFKIDEELFDPMLGAYSPEKLEGLFGEFVEVCHHFGIRVILDFIPRTAARDNDLVLEHPDWFYWIKKEKEAGFRPPRIPGVPFASYDKKYARAVYTAPETAEFLKNFTFSPDKIDAKKWRRLVSAVRSEKTGDFMDIISREFGITTVPGFSDVINDDQPLWTETSFLRMFDDLPADARNYIPKEQPPYALFDIIKSSKAPGRKPNRGLWDLLCSVLPYWQKKFSIDGVRIDMAHALPLKLEERILKAARRVNRDFLLIAEELDNANSGKAAKAGYHAIIGNFWAVEGRWKNGNFKKVFESDIPGLKVPLMAASETHDTPRSVTRPGKKRFYYFSLVLNYYIPNTLTFINTGFELMERHPMNKGLDSAQAGLRGLPFWDLNFGKLALFDYTCFHWNRENGLALRLMERCRDILRRYPEIKHLENFRILAPDHPALLVYSIRCAEPGKTLLFVANTDMNSGNRVSFNLSAPPIRSCEVLQSSLIDPRLLPAVHEFVLRRVQRRMNDISVKVKKSEVLLLLIRHV